MNIGDSSLARSFCLYPNCESPFSRCPAMYVDSAVTWVLQRGFPPPMTLRPGLGRSHCSSQLCILSDSLPLNVCGGNSGHRYKGDAGVRYPVTVPGEEGNGREKIIPAVCIHYPRQSPIVDDIVVAYQHDCITSNYINAL